MGDNQHWSRLQGFFLFSIAILKVREGAFMLSIKRLTKGQLWDIFPFCLRLVDEECQWLAIFSDTHHNYCQIVKLKSWHKQKWHDWQRVTLDSLFNANVVNKGNANDTNFPDDNHCFNFLYFPSYFWWIVAAIRECIGRTFARWQPIHLQDGKCL